MIGLFFIFVVSLSGLIGSDIMLFRKGFLLLRTHPFFIFFLPRCSVFFALSLFVLFAFHIVVIDYAAKTQIPFPHILSNAPIIPLIETVPYYAHTSEFVSIAVETCSFLESIFLVLLWFSLDSFFLSLEKRCIFFFIFVCMLALSLFSAGVSSADLLAYVGDARLGTGCYAGLADFHHTSFELVGNFWGFPFIRCAYGPFWLLFVHVFVGFLPSLSSSLLVLRALDIFSFVSCLYALIKLRVGYRFLFVLMLDPVLVLQYVVDGHNDLFMVSFILWARVAALSKRPLVATFLSIFAGLSKINFLILVPLVFFKTSNLPLRFLYAFSSFLVVVVGSVLLGGKPYLDSLLLTTSIYHVPKDSFVHWFLTIATLCTILSVFCLLFSNRYRWLSAFGFSSLGSVVFPWYLAWGIPYAALDSLTALPFLASFPLLSFAYSTPYKYTFLWPPLVCFLMFISLILFYLSIRPLFMYLKNNKKLVS